MSPPRAADDFKTIRTRMSLFPTNAMDPARLCEGYRVGIEVDDALSISEQVEV